MICAHATDKIRWPRLTAKANTQTEQREWGTTIFQQQATAKKQQTTMAAATTTTTTAKLCYKLGTWKHRTWGLRDTAWHIPRCKDDREWPSENTHKRDEEWDAKRSHLCLLNHSNKNRKETLPGIMSTPC